jgi:uncharacterized protein (TIGR02246 family)
MTQGEVLEVIDRFNAAWNAHDLEGALALVSDDCVFESTSPPPDGERHQGRAAVEAAWKAIFADTRSHFEVEEVFVAGDRVVQRWCYEWGDGHVRGVDVMVVRSGQVVEKLSYVKG